MIDHRTFLAMLMMKGGHHLLSTVPDVHGKNVIDVDNFLTDDN